MTVGVVTTSFPRFEGDPAGSFVEGLSRWLARYHDVEVVCADAERPLFYRGGAPEELSRGGTAWLAAAAFSSRLAIEVAWRARRWDRIVSHWMVPCGIAAAIAARPRRLPHLCIAHGSDSRLLASSRVGLGLARWLAAESELVYVAEALRLEGVPGRVAPMGVEVEALRASEGRVAARQQLGLSDDTLVLVWLGRLTVGKGPDVLCDALSPPLPGVVALVAGDGPWSSELRTRAANNPSVRSMGQLVGAAKASMLASADVLVLSSRVDAAPVVIAEAQACGLPVVASRVGGVPELLTDGVDGLLTAPGDALALRAAILRLQQTPSLRKTLAAASLARGVDRHWDMAAPRVFGRWLPPPTAKASRDPHVFEVRRV